MKEETGSLCDREVISLVKSPLGVVGRREARIESLRQLEVTIILEVKGGRWGLWTRVMVNGQEVRRQI